MRRQLEVGKFKQQIAILGALNNSRTVLLATNAKGDPKQTKYIIKVVNFVGIENMLDSVPNVMKRVYGSNQPIIYKPEMYVIDDRDKLLYMVEQVFSLSLEGLILYHQKAQQRINHWLIHNFACKLYDSIVRVKNSGTQFYHRNLKPSNIFIELKESQVEWKISQFGVLTRFPNKYYLPIIPTSIKSKANISNINDQYENDLHALAIMLAEMVTLTPVDAIYAHLTQDKSIKDLKGMKEAQRTYGDQIIDFIVQLLRHRDNTKEVFQRFRENVPEFTSWPNYRKLAIEWDYDRFEKLLPQKEKQKQKQSPYEWLIQRLKKQLQHQNMACEQVIKKAEKYDPDLQFTFSTYDKLYLFLREFGVQLEDEQLVQIGFMMRCASVMNYMDLIKECYESQLFIQAVIKTGIETYPTRKQFFNSNSGGRDFWSAEDITKYLNSANVRVDFKEVAKVVEGWSGVNKRTSIKYQEFNKIFKGIGNETSAIKNQSKMKSQTSEKTIHDVLVQLKNDLEKDHKNLLNFFRQYDYDSKWVVGAEIERMIKNRIVIPEKIYSQIMNEMWEIAGMSNETKKILLYVKLLKITKIYPLVDLFKMIVVEKINSESRQAVYRQFQKDGKGWSVESIIDFNDQEQLDFDQRELNIIFSEIDKDKSGYLSQKQLIFHLTGLKQFDKDFIIENIKQNMGGHDLFSVFMRYDSNKDLYLETPYNLQQIFEHLGIDVPTQHCIDLFNACKRSEMFPYMDFLRNFIPPSQLFVKACIFFIDHFYQGNFQKFYEMGRIKNKKKWSLDSFNYINEYYIMGFTYNQVGQIWQKLNPEKQESLTKEEVAKIFNCSCDPEEQILGVDSAQKQNIKEIIKIGNEETKKLQKKTTKDSPGVKAQQKNKNELVQSILSKKLNQVALCFIQKSRQNGELSFADFCHCLDDLKIKYLRNVLMKDTHQFQRMDNTKNTLMINFVNLLMFICQAQGEGKQQRKAQCLSVIIKQLMRFYELGTEDIFKKCRKPGTMKLRDYEDFIKDLVKTQVYFDDIEDTWKYWGTPEYLSAQDFNKITNSTSVFGRDKAGLKIARHFSFGSGEVQRKATDEIQSPYFQNNKMKSRKSSRDSKDAQSETPYQLKVNEVQKNRNSMKQQGRPSRQGSMLGNNLPPRPSIKKSVEVDMDKKYERRQQKKQEKKDQKKEDKQLSRAAVVDKFENKIKQKGSDSLNSLFSRSNAVTVQQFSSFIELNYGMQPAECQKLAEAFNSFGKVKMETVKKYIKKIQSPQKKQKPEQVQRQSLKKESDKREPYSRKQISKGKDTKQPIIINESLRLEDPRKMRLNIPLIKQHIKILMGSFSKKFDINQMQPYFFEGNTTLNKEQFIKKCQEINPSISKSMYQKIFSYLKPRAGQVSSIAFKLSFSFDEDIQLEETYLPEEIEKEIKTIFEKADKDSSGFIEVQEIETILSNLGLNQTQKQIENYFQRIDQNFDKKISFKEFKMFIEENILPYISDFDEEVDYLTNLLKMNDVFRTGCLPVTTLGAVLQRYGVKLGEKDLNTLNRFMANQSGEISIKDLIGRLYFPSSQSAPSSLKAILYRIRWKRKISFKEVQKVFENISASFVMSYTTQIVKNKFVTPSTFITPVLNECRLFYNDYYYSNFAKLEEKIPNLINSVKPTDMVVEIKMVDASGIPIPQNPAVKNAILNRSVNVTFYDTSIEQAKDCILNLQVQFDPDVEDQWVFNKNNRSIFVKVANFEPRKYQKIFILFQFVVTMQDGQKSIDISCGSASFPVKELQVEAKATKRVRMIAGLPNKSKDIDKMTISKRKGWRGLIGSGEIESQFQVEIVPTSKIQDKIQQVAALPQKAIVNRKALHLMWTFREYFAYKAADQKRINPDFGNHFIVRTFLLALDIPDVYEELLVFWKQKIQPRVPTVDLARRVFHFLMVDLHIAINSKQFELLPSYPSKNTYGNKTLKSARKKLLQEVFANIEEWVVGDLRKEYRRKKTYNVDSVPFIIEERELAPQTRQISNQLLKIK